MAATRNASRWSIARLFSKPAPAKRGKKDFGTMPFMGSRTYMVTPGSPVWMDRDYAKFAAEGYVRNVIAHRCIGMVAQGAACVPVKLFSKSRRGVRKQITQHPLLDMLSRPNPAQAHASFMEAIYQYRMIAGNSFVQAVGGNGSAPEELHVLRPDRVAIIAGENGQPSAYRYTVNGEYQDFKIDSVTWASRILHVKTFHPLNDWYGLSPIEAVAYSIDQHNQAGAWNQALLQNGARPSGALVVKGPDGQPGSLNEDQYYRLKAQIDEQFSGPVNAGRPMLLEGGLDWKELSLSPKDMDFIQSKNTSARDIALGFGVPPQMLGIPGDNTYSNLQEARLALWEQTIVPTAKSTIHAMGHWLCPMFDGSLELCPDFDGIPALVTKNQALWDMMNAATFVTPDEKRAAVGYPPLGGIAAQLQVPSAKLWKYSPEQPRDDHGRWTDEGGDVSDTSAASDAQAALGDTGGSSLGSGTQEAMGAMPEAAELAEMAEAARTAEAAGQAATAAEDATTLAMPEGIPEDWNIMPSDKGGGIKYVDPTNDGSYVRVMPGNPDSQFPNSQIPNVRWQVNGQTLDVNGNPVSIDTPDAHIPLQDFKFDLTRYKKSEVYI